MFCGRCGNQLDDDMLFCSNCGAKVKKDPAPMQPSQPAPQNYPQQNVYSYGNENRYADNNYDMFAAAPQGNPHAASAQKNNPKGKNNKKLFVIIGVAVAVILAVVIAVFAFGKGGGSGLSSIASTPADKLLNATRKTLFESQSASVDVSVDGMSADFSIGQGINGVRFFASTDYESAAMKDGIVYFDGESISVREIVSEFSGEQFYGYGVNDLVEIAEKLLNNKIDEKVFADVYNTLGREFYDKFLKSQYVMNLSSYDAEQYVDEVNRQIYYDKVPVDTQLPSYDAVMNLAQKLLNKAVDEGAITITEDGEYFNYTFNAAAALRCAKNFINEEESLRSIISSFAKAIGEDEADFYEEFEYLIGDMAEDNIVFSGRYKIENGYIVYVNVSLNYGYDVEPLFDVRITGIGSTEVSDSAIAAAGDPYYYDYY